MVGNFLSYGSARTELQMNLILSWLWWS